MGAENDILELLSKRPEGTSISEIAGATGHTRATAAKYLELMKLQNKVSCREVGKAKLWLVSQTRKKILIAEDEGHIRRLVKVILREENCDFIEAGDGKEALEKVSEEMPDLIILDLMMPKIDGLRICRQLKKNALTRKVPVIMLTAKGEMADKVVGIQLGADDYLTKPFEPEELRARVRTFLGKGNRERNPITNLPTFDYIIKKLNNLNENMQAYYLFFKSIGQYKKSYGFSKTNELIRLTAHIFTHTLERIGKESFVGNDKEDDFILIVEGKDAKYVLGNIQDELESVIPFFYDIDYENIDMKKNRVIKTNSKGEIEEIPMLHLEHRQLKKEDFGNLSEKLKQIREGAR